MDGCLHLHLNQTTCSSFMSIFLMSQHLKTIMYLNYHDMTVLPKENGMGGNETTPRQTQVVYSQLSLTTRPCWAEHLPLSCVISFRASDNHLLHL